MAKSQAQLAMEAYKKSQATGRYTTTSGGKVYSNPVAKQKDAAVKSASQQQASGNYRTTSGGTVRRSSSGGSSGSSGGGYVNRSSKIPTTTQKFTITKPSAPRINYNARAAVQAATQKAKAGNISGDYRTRYGGYVSRPTYTEDEQGAATAAYDAAGARDLAIQAANQDRVIGAYRTLTGGQVMGDAKEAYQTAAEKKNPFTGDAPGYAAPTGLNKETFTLDRQYTPTAETWRSDPGIVEMMNRFYGGVEQLYYNDTNGNSIAFPMENLNLGDGRYVANLLQYWNRPDSMIMTDSRGNRMTLGDIKRGLAEGMYNRSNTAAYNQWAPGVTQGDFGAATDYAAEAYSSGYDDGGILDAYADYIDAAAAAILGQQTGINQQYDSAAADAYAQYMRAKLGLPEDTAGMATGMADSLLVQNDLNYQNNLLANEQNRANALQGVQSEAAQVRAEGALAQAELAAQLAQQAYEREMAERQFQWEQQQALNKQNSTRSSDGGGDDETIWTPAYSAPSSSETFGALLQPGSGYSAGQGTTYNGVVDSQAYYVPGIGRISGAEVRRGIESGQINVEMDSNGQYFFRKAG